MTTRQLERTVAELRAMNRPDLVSVLHDLKCSFKLDFTEEFLNSISLDRLRHIVLAAKLHAINADMVERVAAAGRRG